MTIASDFLALWHDYRTPIASLISDRVRYDTREQREDMVQEVYARAWAAMCEDYGATINPRGWLFTIAHNLIVDYYRQRGRRKAPEPLVDFLEDTKPQPADLIEQAMDVERMQYLAASLTPAQQHVILRRCDGYEFSEIAIEIGSSVNAVKSVKYRAAAQMQRYLEQL